MNSVAVVLAANLITFGFVAAAIYAQRHPGYNLPPLVGAGLLLPLAFIVLTMLSIGQTAPHGG